MQFSSEYTLPKHIPVYIIYKVKKQHISDTRDKSLKVVNT